MTKGSATASSGPMRRDGTPRTPRFHNGKTVSLTVWGQVGLGSTAALQRCYADNRAGADKTTTRTSGLDAQPGHHKIHAASSSARPGESPRTPTTSSGASLSILARTASADSTSNTSYENFCQGDEVPSTSGHRGWPTSSRPRRKPGVALVARGDEGYRQGCGRRPPGRGCFHRTTSPLAKMEHLDRQVQRSLRARAFGHVEEATGPATVSRGSAEVPDHCARTSPLERKGIDVIQIENFRACSSPPTRPGSCTRPTTNAASPCLRGR